MDQPSVALAARSSVLERVGYGWVEAKRMLLDVTGLSQDALHIHLALVLLLIVAALLRSRPDRVVPWMVVLSLQLLNEAVDLAFGGDPDRARALAASWHDIVNTMVWPTVLLVAGRWLRRQSLSGGERQEPLE